MIKIDMNIEIMIGLIGIAVGAALQYFFSQRIESAKHIQILRAQAYTDFIKSLAASAGTQRHPVRKSDGENVLLLADARGRIAIYGTPKVIERLNVLLDETDGSLTTPASQELFSEVVRAMREDGHANSSNVTAKQLKSLLFG